MAIIEAVRKWKRFLAGRHFKLKTDQRSVVYMFDNKKRTKIRNKTIQGWRLELKIAFLLLHNRTQARQRKCGTRFPHPCIHLIHDNIKPQ
eukprot:gene6675-7432_t